MSEAPARETFGASDRIPTAVAAPAPGLGIGLSVVIPTYNEAKRLPPTLRAIARATSAARNGFGGVEILIVDDGSSDGTVEIAEAMGARALRLGARRGAGTAVRRGMLVARGARVLLCDADGAVPFAEIAPLADALDRGFDIAAGSRVIRPASVEVQQPWHRMMMGRAWARLVYGVLPTSVRDTQCGFKLFTRAAAQAVFSRARSNGFAFHVEALSLADALGLRIAELPVRWRDQPGSKVRLLRDSVHMTGELLGAAWRHRVSGNL